MGEEGIIIGKKGTEAHDEDERTGYCLRSRTKKPQTREEEKHHTPDTLGRQIEEWMGKEEITLETKGTKAQDEDEGTGYCLRSRMQQQQTRAEEEEKHHTPDTLGRQIANG